jgi:protein-disulfide isomerase
MRFSFRTALDVGASIAMLICSCVLLWMFVLRPNPTQGSEPIVPVPKSPIAISAASSRGSESAQWAVIEFSDFQCPFCGQFARKILPTILRDYVDTGKVRYSFKHFPVRALHPDAESAAMAADCAGKQNKFWAMHDLLFRNQTGLTAFFGLERGIELDLDKSRFLECMAGPRVPVEQAIALAKDLRISATPTFFVGSVLPNGEVAVKRTIVGASPKLKEALEDLLNSPRR